MRNSYMLFKKNNFSTLVGLVGGIQRALMGINGH